VDLFFSKYLPIPFSRQKSQIDRNIKQAGYMTKDSGKHVSYGVPYDLLPNPASSSSANPTRRTQKKMEEQTQLRLDVKKHNPSLFLLLLYGHYWSVFFSRYPGY
jgi:hypothetical protein